MPRIRVAKLGERVQELHLPDGATIATLLEQAIVQSGFELRVNNMPAKPDVELQDGDIVTLVPQIRGG